MLFYVGWILTTNSIKNIKESKIIFHSEFKKRSDSTMADIEEISPFCVGFTIFQYFVASVVTYVLYKVILNPMLIISMSIEWFIVAIKSSCSAVYNLPTGLFWLIFCFMFGMAVCGFLIRRYWTGKTRFHAIL